MTINYPIYTIDTVETEYPVPPHILAMMPFNRNGDTPEYIAMMAVPLFISDIRDSNPYVTSTIVNPEFFENFIKLHLIRRHNILNLMMFGMIGDEDMFNAARKLYYYLELYLRKSNPKYPNPFEFNRSGHNALNSNEIMIEMVNRYTRLVSKDLPRIIQMAMIGNFTQSHYLHGGISNGMVYHEDIMHDFVGIMELMVIDKQSPSDSEGESETDDTDECCICAINKNPIRFAETHCCNHKEICIKCFHKIMRCPFCRKDW